MNQVQLIGRLGQAPEVKTLSSGQVLVKISLAVNKNKDEVNWVRVNFFGQAASIAEKYLFKGDQVGVVGSINVRSYEKDGEKRELVEINGHNITLLGEKRKEKSLSDEGKKNVDDLPF